MEGEHTQFQIAPAPSARTTPSYLARLGISVRDAGDTRGNIRFARFPRNVAPAMVDPPLAARKPTAVFHAAGVLHPFTLQ